jgi:hypothetical protein
MLMTTLEVMRHSMTGKADWKQTPMTELIVVGFKKDMYRASGALNMPGNTPHTRKGRHLWTK